MSGPWPAPLVTDPDAAEDPPAPDAEDADAEPVLPSPWERVPPVRIFPRLGMFIIPPREPGYYSLLDVLRHNSRPGPPNFPYPPTSLVAFSFFDADFRYLEKPNNTQRTPTTATAPKVIIIMLVELLTETMPP